jgi:hypothetical protein
MNPFLSRVWIQPCSQIHSFLSLHWIPLLQVPLLSSVTPALVYLIKKRVTLIPARENLILGLCPCVPDAGIAPLSLYGGARLCVYIDSSGVKTIDIQALKHVSITDEYWCLVDSNKKLEALPTAVYSLGTFIIQSASPRDKTTESWTKYPRPCRSFFMKEWDLSELIIAYVS